MAKIARKRLCKRLNKNQFNLQTIRCLTRSEWEWKIFAMLSGNGQMDRNGRRAGKTVMKQKKTFLHNSDFKQLYIIDYNSLSNTETK
jgi:hypothetical protein